MTHFLFFFSFLTTLSSTQRRSTRLWYNKSDIFLRLPLFGFYSGEKTADKNF